MGTEGGLDDEDDAPPTTIVMGGPHRLEGLQRTRNGGVRAQIGQEGWGMP